MFAGDIHLIYADSDVGNIESRLSEDILHVWNIQKATMVVKCLHEWKDEIGI